MHHAALTPYMHALMRIKRYRMEQHACVQLCMHRYRTLGVSDGRHWWTSFWGPKNLTEQSASHAPAFGKIAFIRTNFMRYPR